MHHNRWMAKELSANKASNLGLLTKAQEGERTLRLGSTGGWRLQGSPCLRTEPWCTLLTWPSAVSVLPLPCNFSVMTSTFPISRASLFGFIWNVSFQETSYTHTLTLPPPTKLNSFILSNLGAYAFFFRVFVIIWVLVEFPMTVFPTGLWGYVLFITTNRRDQINVLSKWIGPQKMGCIFMVRAALFVMANFWRLVCLGPVQSGGVGSLVTWRREWSRRGEATAG